MSSAACSGAKTAISGSGRVPRNGSASELREIRGVLVEADGLPVPWRRRSQSTRGSPGKSVDEVDCVEAVLVR